MDNISNKMEENQELPEAGASATVKIKSPAGYEYLFTLRDMSAKNLLFKIDAMEKHFITNGFTPVAQGFGKTEKPKKECPIHKIMMSAKVSKKSGKDYHSHWEGTYPNLGRQCFGNGWMDDSQSNNNHTEPDVDF